MKTHTKIFDNDEDFQKFQEENEVEIIKVDFPTMDIDFGYPPMKYRVIKIAVVYKFKHNNKLDKHLTK